MSELTSLPTEDDREIIFQPNPGPQTDFLSASEQEVLYGGAAGGGKSYGLVADALRDFDNPHFKGLLVRRTNDELREILQICGELMPYFNAKWSAEKKTWYHPNGGYLWLSYLDKDQDVLRYQGQAFTWIGFDELTQWPTPYPWDYLRSRLRTTTKSNLNTYMRATTNPGGPGHVWVKKTFIDPAPWGKAFWATDIETGKVLKWPEGHSSGKGGQPLFKRRFIPSKLSDNPYLNEDGKYEAKLLTMPEHLRKQLLEGDWDIAEGMAFPEWNRHIHVIEPFHIDEHWVKFRACDYGYGSKSAVLWFAILPSGQLVVYRELYTSKVTADVLADMIREEEAGERIQYGILDSSLWHKRGDPGPSIAEVMNRKGCRWRPSDRSKGSRVAGKNELHRLLQLDPYTQEPGIMFFNTCINIISEIPVLPLDKSNPEDVDTKSDDHGYDALRYGIMSRPKPFSFDTLHTKTYTPADNTFGY